MGRQPGQTFIIDAQKRREGVALLRPGLHTPQERRGDEKGSGKVKEGRPVSERPGMAVDERKMKKIAKNARRQEEEGNLDFMPRGEYIKKRKEESGDESMLGKAVG